MKRKRNEEIVEQRRLVETKGNKTFRAQLPHNNNAQSMYEGGLLDNNTKRDAGKPHDADNIVSCENYQ